MDTGDNIRTFRLTGNWLDHYGILFLKLPLYCTAIVLYTYFIFAPMERQYLLMGLFAFLPILYLIFVTIYPIYAVKTQIDFEKNSVLEINETTGDCEYKTGFRNLSFNVDDIVCYYDHFDRMFWIGGFLELDLKDGKVLRMSNSFIETNYFREKWNVKHEFRLTLKYHFPAPNDPYWYYW